MAMPILALLAALLAAEPQRPFTSPSSPSPEYGHGLTEQDAQDGWISLFDGESGFGWKDAKVDGGVLSEGETTARFAAISLRAEAASPGEFIVGEQKIK